MTAGPRTRTDATTSDAALLALVAAGDLDALGALYARHRDPVRRFVLRVTRQHDDAQDILHDTFLTAAAIAARFDGRESCRPWLVGIAGRLVQQRNQKLARLARYLSRLAPVWGRIHDPAPVLEARSGLAAGLDRLSAAKRVVLVMAEVEGLTCAEIATALEIPIGTVWTRLHHARRELAATMETR